MPPPKVGTRLIVIDKGNGEKGPAIFKFALEGQLADVKKMIAEAPRYRLVNLVYVNGQLAKDKGPVKPVWEGNNPEEVRNLWRYSDERTALTVRNSTFSTVLQLQTKQFGQSNWKDIRPYEIGHL